MGIDSHLAMIHVEMKAHLLAKANSYPTEVIQKLPSNSMLGSFYYYKYVLLQSLSYFDISKPTFMPL